MQVRRLFEAFNEPFRKELRPFTLPPTAAAAPNSARTAAAAVTVGAANATAAAADTRANNSGLAATRGRSQSLVRAVNGGTSPSDASLDHGLGSEGVYGVRGLLAQTPNSTSTADDLVRQGLELRQLDGGNHLRADHASAAASSSETHAAADSQQELGYPADSVDAETNIEASDNAEGVQGGWAWVLTQRLLPGDDFYDDDGEDDVVDV